MAKTPRKRELSLLELYDLASQRRAELEDRRAELQGELGEIESELEMVNSTGLRGRRSPTAKGRRRGRKQVGRRVSGQRPLREVLVDVLKKHPKGMDLKELTRAVLKAGYKTQSRMFDTTVYQCLYTSKEFIRDKRSRKYRLKGRTPAGSKSK